MQLVNKLFMFMYFVLFLILLLVCLLFTLISFICITFDVVIHYILCHTFYSCTGVPQLNTKEWLFCDRWHIIYIRLRILSDRCDFQCY